MALARRGPDPTGRAKDPTAPPPVIPAQAGASRHNRSNKDPGLRRDDTALGHRATAPTRTGKTAPPSDFSCFMFPPLSYASG